jgi:hypothetical protein
LEAAVGEIVGRMRIVQPQVAQQMQVIQLVQVVVQQMQAMQQQMQAMQQQLTDVQEQIQVIQIQNQGQQFSPPATSQAAGPVVPFAPPGFQGNPPQQLMQPIDCWWMSPGPDPTDKFQCKYAGKHCRENTIPVYWVHFSNKNHRGGVHALLCHSCGLANRAEIDGLVHV